MKKKNKKQAVEEEPAVAKTPVEEEAPKKKKKKKQRKQEEPAVEEAPVEVAAPKKKKLKKKKRVAADPAPAEEEVPKKKKQKQVVEAESASDEEFIKVTKAPSKKEEVSKEGEEEWKDIMLTCVDCAGEFTDTIADQEFRWSKGFADAPKRCKDCNWEKKQRIAGKDGGGKGKDGKGKGKDGKGKGKGGGGICYKFQAGNCTFTDCKFSHDV